MLAHGIGVVDDLPVPAWLFYYGAALVLIFSFVALGVAASPTRNIAPSFVYVTFWLGMPLASVVLGNVWPALDPWRAAANGIAWAAGRAGVDWRPPLRYPPG